MTIMHYNNEQTVATKLWSF